MTLAYCPAFDFNPEETKMKLEEIKTILEDTSLTLNQKAANLEAAILKASTPSALNIKPKQDRKKREAKAPKSSISTSADPRIGIFKEADDHAEH